MSTGEDFPSVMAVSGEMGDTADTETETEVSEVTVSLCEAGSRSPGSGLASSSWTESGTGAGAGDRGAPFLSGARYAGARPVLSTSLGSMEAEVEVGWNISWRTLKSLIIRF